jgi:hypothetical protein
MGTAQAFNWKGFSELCFDCTTRGNEGDKVVVTITRMQVNSQCYNINTGNFTQPGVGNAGNFILEATSSAVPGKTKGVIEFGGCLDLSPWGKHVDHEVYYGFHGEYPPEHLCHPHDNVNKWEWIRDEGGEDEAQSVYVSWLEAEWWWYNDKNDNSIIDRGELINEGTDICTWTGDIINGIPEHDKSFQCTEETLKKLNCNIKLKE